MNLQDLSSQAHSLLQLKIESAAPSLSYLANGFVFTWGMMTFNQIMMLIGTVFAVATYFTSLYFQRRRDRREQELHQHRIALEMQGAEKAADRADRKEWQGEDAH